ncbi:MAG: hypothetical protein J7L66_00650 [Anaerolineaceae bacterium]|nr:hypothetical protein [Anaerolineaceae bacterium]
MFKKITRSVGRGPQKREMMRLSKRVQLINQLEEDLENLSSNELRAKTDIFRNRLAKGETLDDLLIEAFAVVREASKRTVGLRHFDVQMIGGIAMHEGMIAEMRTGEGKTLVATLPLYLNALTGEGVHLVTVNDYLARRDARWMAPIYNLLGMKVGVLQMSQRTNNARNAFLVNLKAHSLKEEDDQLQLVPRREAYAADITYGTNNEFGFDYLRDNLIMDIRNRVQRGHNYAIIDEVDNILIDEARTPLIISGPASEDVEWYSRMAAVVKQLDPEDFDYNEKDRTIALTEIGEIHVEELLQTPLRDPDRPEDITPQQARLLGYLEQALKAEILFKKNKDYIVQNKQVIIVDAFTGRLMPGRRWSEGLHQAIEAKENVKVNPENITHATITLQNYFRKYKKLSGMTGTALTEAEEFSTIYGLDVLEIPTNLDYEAAQPDSPLVVLQAKDEERYTYTYYALKNDPKKLPVYWKRKDYPDIVFRTEEAKLRAICMEIIRFHILGRPQLVGTTSIEHSERLSARLQADLLRRLLTVILIRLGWMQKNNVDILEKAVPELAPLNEPLPKVRAIELRQFTQKINIPHINLESPKNIIALLNFFNLPQSMKERMLNVIKGGIPHQVLNALNHDRESQIIESAGAFGAVTIATNMAGRGVDIKLGGEIRESILSDVRSVLSQASIDPYGMSNSELAEALDSLELEPDNKYAESIQTFHSFLKNMRLVRKVGGLHVIGSERHEARRIDNQLRGRSGRQGDPGSSRFYLSLEDDLMRMFGGERAENMMRFFNLDASIPLESKIIGRLVEQAQQRVEGYNFDIRKHLLDYDDVLNDQRERIYSERDQVLVKKDLNEDVWGMLESEISQRVKASSTEPDGLWKLLAFLDEIQPTIFYQKQNERLPSFTLSKVAEYAKSKISDFSDKNSIKEVLIDIAQRTLLAEKDHFINQIREFFKRSMDSYQTQINERLDLLDIFFDTMEDRAEQTSSEITTQLQKAVHLKIKLTTSETEALLAQDPGARMALTKQVEENLKRIFLSRIVMTIEHRLRQKLGVNIDKLSVSSWDEVEKEISDIISERFDARAALSNQPNHPIVQNLEKVLRRQLQSPAPGLDVIELLASMAFGIQVTINQQTHQQTVSRINTLNYVFFGPQILADLNPQQLTESVLNHFKEIQDHLQAVWGKMEMERIAESQINYTDLPKDYQDDIEKYLTDETATLLHKNSLTDLLNNNVGSIINAFGKKVQQIIYRHILLQSISEFWIEHLTKMEALRVSIRMEAYAKQDPLIQYKSYSTDAFTELLSNIRLSVISKMFRLQPSKQKSSGSASEQENEQNKNQTQNLPKKKKKRKRHKKK